MSLAWNFCPAERLRLELFTGTVRFLEFAETSLLVPTKALSHDT